MNVTNVVVFKLKITLKQQRKRVEESFLRAYYSKFFISLGAGLVASLVDRIPE